MTMATSIRLLPATGAAHGKFGVIEIVTPQRRWMLYADSAEGSSVWVRALHAESPLESVSPLLAVEFRSVSTARSGAPLPPVSNLLLPSEVPKEGRPGAVDNGKTVISAHGWLFKLGGVRKIWSR